ncbi:MAG: hypothetical protein IJW47_04150 [Clostridia bacterium]|nr:hypothetical protein [Clostridia bacterium]
MGKGLNRLKYFGYIKFRNLKYFLKGLISKDNKKRFKDALKSSPRKVSYGMENKDKTFYVARRFSQVEGHCSLLMTMLGHCNRAIEMGMIPVIDMQNYYSELWQDETRKGKDNAWEYFYEQPGGYTLPDISRSKNILLSDGVHARKAPSYRTTFDSETKISFWHEIYKKHIHFNIETKKCVSEIKKKFLFSQGKILAVSVRRGIEWGHKINDEGFKCHLKVPDFETIITDAKKLKKEWGCDKIFLVIDDEEGLERFKFEFPNEVLYVERDRRKYFINGLPNPGAEKDFVMSEQIYDREVKYLAEVMCIAECSSFLGTKSSTSLASMIIKGSRFKNLQLYGE